MTRDLNRKRHVRAGGRHAELAKQPDQFGVGALIENEKTGVHAMTDGSVRAREGEVDRMRMAAEIVARLKKSDVRPAAQAMRHSQTRYAGADDGQLHALQTAALGGSRHKKRVCIEDGTLWLFYDQSVIFQSKAAIPGLAPWPTPVKCV